jgi:hypothetical protein
MNLCHFVLDMVSRGQVPLASTLTALEITCVGTPCFTPMLEFIICMTKSLERNRKVLQQLKQQCIIAKLEMGLKAVNTIQNPAVQHYKYQLK